MQHHCLPALTTDPSSHSIHPGSLSPFPKHPLLVPGKSELLEKLNIGFFCDRIK